jgi:hypothetical protein
MRAKPKENDAQAKRRKAAASIAILRGFRRAVAIVRDWRSQAGFCVFEVEGSGVCGWLFLALLPQALECSGKQSGVLERKVSQKP